MLSLPNGVVQAALTINIWRTNYSMYTVLLCSVVRRLYIISSNLFDAIYFHFIVTSASNGWYMIPSVPLFFRVKHYQTVLKELRLFRFTIESKIFLFNFLRDKVGLCQTPGIHMNVFFLRNVQVTPHMITIPRTTVRNMRLFGIAIWIPDFYSIFGRFNGMKASMVSFGVESPSLQLWSLSSFSPSLSLSS